MMIDWTSTMAQSFEFYMVDPGTWKDRALLTTITSCNINRDLSNVTLGSATVDSTEALNECYVRVYLKAIQNGVTERVPLGTFLVQTPATSSDGKVSSVSMDAYTPLIELKGSPPPIGYALLKGTNVMESAYALCRENLRAPVVRATSDTTLETDFVSSIDEKWITFVSDLIAKAKYQFGLDEMGRIIFEPVQDMRSLRPVWIYTDDNSSILYPNFKDERDLYNVPNVVEVVYSTSVGYRSSRIVNDDPNSPVSTVNRGREVVHRDSNPSFSGVPSQRDLDEYAKQLLRNLSSLEHTITYSHGYCPVRIGDCVLLDHKRFGLVNVKAKVISQSIKCETGCSVEETAVYTTKLWG
jgi:hypothetical protein